MKTITAALTLEKNKLNTTSAWLPLITVDVSSSVTLRLVPNPEPIIFDGETYSPFGLHIDTVSQDTRGGLNDVRISVSNVTREVGAYLEANELRGARVRVLYVNSANLADASAIAIEELYEIMAISVHQQVATFILGHERLLSHRFPGGRFFRDNCRWIYKSVECGYVGPLATCDKVLEGSNGCRAHHNIARFGAFPGIPSLRGR